MNNNKCQFEVNTQTSSATICKWCGKEKWEHEITMSNNKQTQLVDFSNPNADKIISASTQKPMNNNKQTAVDWLIEKLSKYNEEMIFLYKNEIEQAKAMHREEVTSFTADWSIQWKYENGKRINEFYNERFGGNK